jgi:hypothetical protein
LRREKSFSISVFRSPFAIVNKTDNQSIFPARCLFQPANCWRCVLFHISIYNLLKRNIPVCLPLVAFHDSSRIVGLVQLLLKDNVSKSVIEDYAACLEYRFDDFQVIENTKDDVGVLILQVAVCIYLRVSLMDYLIYVSSNLLDMFHAATY